MLLLHLKIFENKTLKNIWVKFHFFIKDIIIMLA